MSVEENKAVVKEFVERYSKWDTSVIDELMTSNYVMHNLGAGREGDKESFKQAQLTQRTNMPDSSTTIEDVFGEGDRVLIRVTVSGKHAPSGKNVTFPRLTIHRLEGGKIAEMWTLVDRLGLSEQTGA